MWKSQLLIEDNKIVKVDICDIGKEMRELGLTWKWDYNLNAWVCKDIKKISEIYRKLR